MTDHDECIEIKEGERSEDELVSDKYEADIAFAIQEATFFYKYEVA